jgi:hypothetical protein
MPDNYGQMWQYDAYNGIWTDLGHPPTPCWSIEGDVSAAVDDVDHVWYAAARCTREDTIALYRMTPGKNWQFIDTITYANSQLTKPLLTTQSAPWPMVNVSYETSAGEQVLTYYVGANRTKYTYSFGATSPATP